MEEKDGVGCGSMLVLGHTLPLTQGTLSTTSHCVTGVDSTFWEISGCEKAAPQVQLKKALLIQK